jgi:hypothetical protein
MKRLHLLIGDPGETSPDALPHLAKLLARGRAEDGPGDPGPSAALARLFGVAVRDLPTIALSGEGIDPGDAAWFRADPVHLLAGMRSLTLFDSRHLDPEADEAAQLVAALNRHFAGEIEFLAPDPARWYARFRNPPEVDVPALDEVADSNVAIDLVAGPGARTLQRTAMEIQMLLHDHPVNQAREARGAATMNGVWFWGGGVYRKPAAPFDRVLSDDFLAHALARAAGIATLPLPERFDGSMIEGNTLAVLPNPAGAADPCWFAPTLVALRQRRIAELRLIVTGPAGQQRRLDWWQALAFWRNRPIQP